MAAACVKSLTKGDYGQSQQIFPTHPSTTLTKVSLCFGSIVLDILTMMAVFAPKRYSRLSSPSTPPMSLVTADSLPIIRRRVQRVGHSGPKDAMFGDAVEGCEQVWDRIVVWSVVCSVPVSPVSGRLVITRAISTWSIRKVPALAQSGAMVRRKMDCSRCVYGQI